MARKTILAETTKSGFVLNDAFDAYWTMEEKPSWIMVADQEYVVVWDGEEFVCTAKAFTREGHECVYVGNTAAEGGAVSEEPFAIVYDIDNGFGHFLSTELDSTHTIAIYQDTSVRVVLKDKDGNDVAYEGVTGVRLHTADGGIVGFSKGEAIDDHRVTLDLTDGDQTVVAPDGALIRSAIIQKPTTLIPGNILKDINIGGILGIHECKASSDIPIFAKKLVCSSRSSDGRILVTAEELSSIGFTLDKRCYFILLPYYSDSGIWGYQYTPKTVSAMLVSNKPLAQSYDKSLTITSTYYGVLVYSAKANGSASYSTSSYTALSTPLSSSPVSNVPYYEDGCIKYNDASSAYVLYPSTSSSATYWVIVGCVK